jgi:hypothetical protein
MNHIAHTLLYAVRSNLQEEIFRNNLSRGASGDARLGILHLGRKALWDFGGFAGSSLRFFPRIHGIQGFGLPRVSLVVGRVGTYYARNAFFNSWGFPS